MTVTRPGFAVDIGGLLRLRLLLGPVLGQGLHGLAASAVIEIVDALAAEVGLLLLLMLMIQMLLLLLMCSG